MRDLVAYHHRRQLHDTDARDRRRAQREHAARHEARLVMDFGLSAVGPAQPPHVRGLRHAVIEARQTREIGGNGRHAMFAQQCGARDEALAALGQHTQREIAVLERRRAHADRDVDPFADHVDAPVGRFQVDLDARALGHERGDHRADQRIEQHDRATDAHDAARLLVQQRDRLVGRIGLDEHRAAMRVIGLADVGDREAARRALDQPHPEPRLEQCDATAQLRFRHVQRAPGRREAAMLDDLHEIVEIVQISFFIVHEMER